VRANSRKYKDMERRLTSASQGTNKNAKTIPPPHSRTKTETPLPPTHQNRIEKHQPTPKKPEEKTSNSPK
jgi:hypothetical protein